MHFDDERERERRKEIIAQREILYIIYKTKGSKREGKRRKKKRKKHQNHKQEELKRKERKKEEEEGKNSMQAAMEQRIRNSEWAFILSHTHTKRINRF